MGQLWEKRKEQDQSSFAHSSRAANRSVLLPARIRVPPRTLKSGRSLRQ